MKGLKLLLALFTVLVGLAGCSVDSHYSKFMNSPIEIYLFGAENSCFPKETPLSCKRLKVYDAVEIKVLNEKQEVSYVRKAIDLDDGNTMFKKLSDCKIVGRSDFECAGLSRVEGRFVDTSVFKDRYVSQSFWTFWYSKYISSSVNRATLEFFDRNVSWLGATLVIVGMLGLLSLLSEKR